MACASSRSDRHLGDWLGSIDSQVGAVSVQQGVCVAEPSENNKNFDRTFSTYCRRPRSWDVPRVGLGWPSLLLSSSFQIVLGMHRACCLHCSAGGSWVCFVCWGWDWRLRSQRTVGNTPRSLHRFHRACVTLLMCPIGLGGTQIDFSDSFHG